MPKKEGGLGIKGVHIFYYPALQGMWTCANWRKCLSPWLDPYEARKYISCTNVCNELLFCFELSWYRVYCERCSRDGQGMARSPPREAGGVEFSKQKKKIF
jgi:hypothetical protein